MKDHAVNWLSRENSEIEPLTPRGAQLLAIQPRTMAQAFAIAAVMALTLTPIAGAQGACAEGEGAGRCDVVHHAGEGLYG